MDDNDDQMFNSSWNQEGPAIIRFLSDTGLNINSLIQCGIDIPWNNDDYEEMGVRQWKYLFSSFLNRYGKYFIRFLLDMGFEANALNKYGSTLLSYCTECGNLENVMFLVQNHADANVANLNGLNTLHVAAQYGQPDIVNFLLSTGMDANSCGSNQFSCLHYIAEKDDVFSSSSWESYKEAILTLMVFGIDLNAVNAMGYTPLLLAAKNSYIEMVDLLIRLGGNVECCNERGWTVLHFACERGWANIVRTLLEGRYNIQLINAQNHEGNAPIFIAAFSSNRIIIELLVMYGADLRGKDHLGMTLLHHASEKGWLDIVNYLYHNEIDLNAKDLFGNTALLCAAKQSQLSVVNRLMEYGADIESRDETEWSLLDFACKNGWVNVVQILFLEGWDLNTTYSWGITPLLRAAYWQQLCVVEYLILCGVEVTSCDTSRMTTLHYACTRGWLGVVKSLIRKGSDLNARNLDNDTPLHLATDKGYFEIVKLLLKAGADCNLRNLIGVSPFHNALQMSSHITIIRRFVRNGAFVQDNDYDSSNILQETRILANIPLCTKFIINKYNYYLSKIYEIPLVREILPSIENFKLAKQNNLGRHISECVKKEIETNGFCNILNARRPIILSRLCVLALQQHRV